MESDLYNLVPAVGEINGLRSNYSFAMIPGEKREFGACDMEMKDRKAEPPPEVKGDIARTYYYMHWAYSGHDVISKKIENYLKSGIIATRLTNGSAFAVNVSKLFKTMKILS